MKSTASHSARLSAERVAKKLHINVIRLMTMGVTLVFGVAGLMLISASRAATNSFSAEAETGSLAGNYSLTTGQGASGSSVKFGGNATTPPTPTPPSGGNTVAVGTAAQLKTALQNAKPGDVITLADGTYAGQFNSTQSGTAAAPITVTGSRNAIINGGSLTSGYTFSLGAKNSASTVSYWRLTGFTVTGGQKGIIFDNVQNSVIDGLLVQNTGQEGIHLRNFSSNNIVQKSTVTKTGQDDQKYGEGLYVGTAQSNWDTVSQGKPDKSNNNQLLNNTISYTGAENIDIKEGTHAGTIKGNSLDGIGMCYAAGDCNFADSLIDMKGEGWTIADNTAKRVHVGWSGAENDAFQVHVISQGASEGSGNNNSFSGNTIDDVGGYGFNVQSSATGTAVKCSNKVTNAAKGFGNVTCSN